MDPSFRGNQDKDHWHLTAIPTWLSINGFHWHISRLRSTTFTNTFWNISFLVCHVFDWFLHGFIVLVFSCWITPLQIRSPTHSDFCGLSSDKKVHQIGFLPCSRSKLCVWWIAHLETCLKTGFKGKHTQTSLVKLSSRTAPGGGPRAVSLLHVSSSTSLSASVSASLKGHTCLGLFGRGSEEACRRTINLDSARKPGLCPGGEFRARGKIIKRHKKTFLPVRCKSLRLFSDFFHSSSSASSFPPCHGPLHHKCDGEYEICPRWMIADWIYAYWTLNICNILQYHYFSAYPWTNLYHSVWRDSDTRKR